MRPPGSLTYEVLGGHKVLGKEPSSSADFVTIVRRGLPFASLEHTRAALNISQAELVEAVGVPRRTLARRRKERRLSVWESERLVRLARVYARAMDVLGEQDRASGWLRRPNRALGKVAPLSLLDTDIGTDAVLAVLGRIAHGVFG